MKRTFEASFINKVLNHPSVHPWVGIPESVDVTSIVENPDNFLLVNDFGGFILVNQSPGVYEVHTQFLPEGRGPNLLKFTCECLEYMFIHTDCHTIVTQLPENNPAARKLAYSVGFHPMFERKDTPRGPTTYAKLTLDEWVHNHLGLAKIGQAFHEKLEACKKEAESMREAHPEDPAHDRVVGAAFEMIKAGNPFKGVEFYNGWAQLAGYLPVILISVNPTVVDVVDAVIELRDDEMEILKCR